MGEELGDGLADGDRGLVGSGRTGPGLRRSAQRPLQPGPRRDLAPVDGTLARSELGYRRAGPTVIVPGQDFALHLGPWLVG